MGQCSARLQASPPDDPIAADVCYCTDIEGNWEYFMSFVKISRALTLIGFDDATGSADIELKDGWDFVCGGDMVDKGVGTGGSIRVTRTMLRLKNKYPDRVTLILGNRDVNKIRFTSELADDELSNLARVPGPDWVKEACRVSPLQYLTRLVAVQKGIPPEQVSEGMLAEANTVANRIRWMLKETMGADGEFERRQAELALLNGGDPVDDDATAASFVDSVRPGGFMYELVRLGVLAHVGGDALFVHGGLLGSFGDSEDCFGFVPGVTQRETHDVHAWVAQLNCWKDEQIADWVARPRWERSSAEAGSSAGGGVPSYARGSRGGDLLIR